MGVVTQPIIEPVPERGLPSGFCCVRCGYELGATRAHVGGPCFECGRYVLQDDLATWVLRQRIEARSVRVYATWAVVWAVLIGGLALVAGWKWGLASLITSACVLAGSVMWSMVLGWVESTRALPQLRRAWFTVWVASAWQLHMPWVMGGVSGAVLSAWGGTPVVALVVLALLPVWVWVSLMLLAQWERRIGNVPLATPRRFTGPALMVVLPNVVIGLVALLMAMG